MNLLVKTVQFPHILNNEAMFQFQREVEDFVKTEIDHIVVDLKSIDFINSAGLMALVMALRLVRSVNKKLFVCSINDQVRMLFEITGMDQVLEIFSEPSFTESSFSEPIELASYQPPLAS